MNKKEITEILETVFEPEQFRVFDSHTKGDVCKVIFYECDNCDYRNNYVCIECEHTLKWERRKN